MRAGEGSSARVFVLLLEDDPLDARLIEAHLARACARFQVERTANGEAFRRALERAPADVILSDYNVPGFDGLSALAAAREMRPEVPFLFVSGALGEERAIELLKRGATDYVLKDNLERLVPCVERALAEAKEREERARAEEALRRSEERSRALIAALVEGITMQDVRGAFVEVNAAAEKLLGLSREEILRHAGPGLPLPVIDEAGETIAAEDQPAAAALRTGESQVGRILGLRRPDGALVWLSVNAQPLGGAGDRAPAGVVSSFFDVTERRQRAEVEQQLIGIVSHDLRTPLTAILNTAEGLLRRAESLDERTTRGMTRIRSSTERAARMVRDLLDFTQVRLGSGIPLLPRTADLHELTRGTLDELESAWSERRLRMEQHGDGSGRWDVDRLVQVVQNLVTNALSYSPDDSTVRVVTRGEDGEVTLEVHNEGAPIPPELLPRLFEATMRGDNRASYRNRSVGLGCFIVYHVVRAHGGSVSVRSTAEHGTTFLVRLPRSVGPRGAR